VSYLLDTNVVSEIRRSHPDPAVVRWVHQQVPGSTYLSVMTVGEIRRGIEHLSRRDPVQAQRLESWFTGIQIEFRGRILPITGNIAEEWARLMVPNPLPIMDAFIVATARMHGLTLVTRNTADVARTGIAVLNPFPASR
jgi:predicted nucleic acid-binding protein